MPRSNVVDCRKHGPLEPSAAGGFVPKNPPPESTGKFTDDPEMPLDF